MSTPLVFVVPPAGGRVGAGGDWLPIAGPASPPSRSSRSPMDASSGQYRFAIGSSSAGKRVMICAPFGVTITSSSMRAAEVPSVAGQ